MTTKVEKCPTCGGDAIDRSEYWECVVENADKMRYQIYEIEKAIDKYYLALDMRKHGGVAGDKTLTEIMRILGKNWNQGEILELCKSNEKLAKIYGYSE